MLAFITSLPVTLMVFYGIGLSGSFVTFWLSYYVTLCNGIAVAYLVRAPGAAADRCQGRASGWPLRSRRWGRPAWLSRPGPLCSHATLHLAALAGLSWLAPRSPPPRCSANPQVAAVSPNMDVANALLPIYVTLLLFFAGQLIRLEDIPR
jgi:hypothetical protein